MLTGKNISVLRKAIVDTLPQIDQAGADVQQQPGFTYVPPSHARALDVEASIVMGMRGSGKSFWWAALSSDAHRRFIAQAFPSAHLSTKIRVLRGFGDAVRSADAPGKDVLAQLIRNGIKARTIWRAVVGAHLDFPQPFPSGTQALWADRAIWVEGNPEIFDRMLEAKDDELAKAKEKALVLFDALDRLGDSWEDVRPLARGLFQVAQDMRGTRNVRLKLFVRPDMLEDREIVGFPDASKLLARKAELDWRRVDLYALFFQCLGNAVTGGKVLRDMTSEVVGEDWERAGRFWTMPAMLASDESLQELVFERLAGKAMSNSPTGWKRGKPYKWIANHLQDGRGQVSPRSFCEALRRAAEMSLTDFSLHPMALHYRAIHFGVQAASAVRVNELVDEDYPWVGVLMEPLRGQITVPCAPDDIIDIWRREKVVQKLEKSVASSHGSSTVKLPPQHLGDGARGVLVDLKDLGLVEELHDGRIQMPDVYRIAFGLGRRGGVRPLK